jgi:hypothetical protein
MLDAALADGPPRGFNASPVVVIRFDMSHFSARRSTFALVAQQRLFAETARVTLFVQALKREGRPPAGW